MFKYSLCDCCDCVSPRLCEIPHSLANSAHLLKAFQDLKTQIQTNNLHQNADTVRRQTPVNVQILQTHTCFSLLWIMNWGRQPRARADPQRVSICGLFSPSVYWNTKRSTHVDTPCRDYFQIKPHIENCGTRKNYIQPALHLYVSQAWLGLVVLLTQGTQGRHHCSLQTYDNMADN